METKDSNILWTQNESPAHPSTILWNGIEVKDETQKLQIFERLSNIVGGKKRRTYSSDNLVIGKNYYLIKGHYENQDTIGRRMPYIFCMSKSKAIPLSDAIDTLKELSVSINRECSSEDLDTLINDYNMASEKGSNLKKKFS